MNKQYIGDGVYIESNEYGFTLTTENEIEITNKILLEPEIAQNLVEYIDNEFKLQQRLEE